MPSAPKPSEKKLRVKKEKAGKVPKSPRVKKVKAIGLVRVKKEGSKSHQIPKRGKCATWLAEITENGGATRQELIDGCAGRGLKDTMHIAMVSYCKQLGILTELKQSVA